MNLNVSWIAHDGRRFHSIALMLGLLQGGEFVTARARALVKGVPRNSFHRPDTEPGIEKLRGSKFDTPEDLAAFSHRLDEGVKRVFSNDRAAQYIKFGSPRDNDPRCGIKAGRLTLTG